ncbi:MAG: D-(-)-3-hydroxybutyrate oligomer hydrolase [Rhodospirillales bacterium]|nr:D-(-)-3-hydroxybutyrate oligomer hydrolase [Rhodospirillales bacterium]
MRKIRIATALLAVAPLAWPAVAAKPAAVGGPAAIMAALGSSKDRCTSYDGDLDDLLTAGLGKSGLAGAAPLPVIPTAPTSEELRRLAIYANYRALVDMTANGGYGTLYGPNVLADGTVTTGEGKIAGTECTTYADDGRGRQNVSLMVQIPESFDPSEPCIVTAPSSGSRGIYGAIATSGEWGLKNGCAVAYTDKGTGTGVHDLENDTINLIDGVRESAEVAGAASNFTARISDGERIAFNAAFPHRIAYKHAHSEQNPEADWGIDVLKSILFAFIELNRHYPQSYIYPANTIVIGSSASNGGGASVRAAEIDAFGLIDGVAVSEPNVNPPRGPAFTIVQGSRQPYHWGGKRLYDYFTRLNIFQGCANLAQPDAPLNSFQGASAEARCASLHAKGLLEADTLAEQAREAQAIINGYGFLREQNIVQPSHWTLFVPQGISVTYANAYARARVQDNLCGFSFGATSTMGDPGALADTAEAILFGTANGIPPTSGINVINNLSPGGAKLDAVSASPSTGAFDQNLDGALCLRALWIGADPVSGAPLTGALLDAHKRLRRNVGSILATAKLNGVPAIFVTGRSDAILPPNHTSRAYFARNRQFEGGTSKLRYIEVTNAQHLDTLNGVGGFDNRFIPLHFYFLQALDRMYAHLKFGRPLPASQVVRTVPRGGSPGAAPAISAAANLPAIKTTPPAADRITFVADTLNIPE